MSRRRARGVSHGAIERSLCDHPERQLFDFCQRRQLTGVLQITSWGRSGRILMRAGEIATATYGALEGAAAVSELLSLRDGLFELRQELPGVPAAGQGAGRSGASALMEQCGERALSCRIEVLSRGQRAVMVYRAGALECVEIDGTPLVDTTHAATALEPFEQGQVQILALPISLHEHAPESSTPAPDARSMPRPAPAVDARPVLARPPRPTPAAPARTLPARPTQTTPARPAPPVPARPTRPTPASPARPAVRPVAYHVVQHMPGQGMPPRRPVATPPPLPVVSRPHAGTAGGFRPWLDNPGPSSATAGLRGAISSRRALAVPALLAVFVLSLVLIIGFVALQQ